MNEVQGLHSDSADWAGGVPPVPELSRKNHFKFGYNGRWYVERQDPADTWCVSYGRSERPVSDWRAECITTARLIRESTDLDLWVMFSGGIDSEVVLQSFIFAGISVNAAITCFRNDLNRQDVRYAVKFCETHAVPYRLLHLDIDRFFESGEALEYADRTKAFQAVRLHTMWAMDQVDGYPILGSGECYLVKRSAQLEGPMTPGVAPEIWEMFEKERVAAWYRHLMVRRRPGCAGFFQFTPEVMLAYLTDPIMADLCTNRILAQTDTMALKPVIYRRHFLLEPRNKYHGFENVAHLHGRFGPELERRYGSYDGISKLAYHELIARLERPRD